MIEFLLLCHINFLETHVAAWVSFFLRHRYLFIAVQNLLLKFKF